MTDQEVAELIGLCSQWWTSWRAPESLPTMIKSWGLLLADVPRDAAVAALTEHATAGTEFPPPPGVIRRRASELTNPAGAPPSTDEAWENVKAEIARVGMTVLTLERTDRKLAFIHPAVEAVATAMGWRELCESTNDVADRAHFTRLYAERIASDLSRRAEPQLVTAVRSRALGTGEPVALGDSIRSLQEGTP